MGCPNCNGQLVTDWTRGEVVCSQCGLVVEEFAVDAGPECRVAGPHQTARIRTAPLKAVNSTEISAKPEHGLRWLALAKFHRGALHEREKVLVSLLAEVKRIAACVGLPRRVTKEAETLAKRYTDATSGREEVVATALLWLAARRMGVLRPLSEFLKCGGVKRGGVAQTALRLSALARPSRPGLEDYVKAVAAKMSLPAEAVERALQILRQNRSAVNGRSPWVCAAAALVIATNWQIPARRFAAAAGVSESSVVDLVKKMSRKALDRALRKRGYIYLGRVGSGYRWAIVKGNYAYMYEMSSATKWRTRYLGRVPVWELLRGA